MPKIEAFEKYSKEYDEWFMKNQDIYLAELNAIKSLIPLGKSGLEIGVGSGRFALPLGIKNGIEPSKKMAEMYRFRGIQVYLAVAEDLPFRNNIFDFVLMVTTICFLDDVLRSVKESYRVLKNDGFIIIGFVDKESTLGRAYKLKKEISKFYKNASFFSVKDVIDFLRKADFNEVVIKQTVFSNGPDKMDAVQNGSGKGSFVIIKAIKSPS